jgi:hypothetical protein
VNVERRNTYKVLIGKSRRKGTVNNTYSSGMIIDLKEIRYYRLDSSGSG